MPIQVQCVLSVLRGLNTHRVYRPAAVAELLASCGFIAALTADESGVNVAGKVLHPVQPEWGEPGISPQSILSVVYETLLGEAPCSGMVGRGFWFRDVLAKLESALEQKCPDSDPRLSG